ncbi:hypothetical protein [Gloeobacter morelensis]|uniref:Uncharacterized protein n=1 Tax=Gloeobacter morelensis MG652769 TaxID=2781736 RepID=A0ABY3PKJ0_9CYAN|nr:hypothetical protein [Gloeobacter morelensis]UFP94161.1 hypothetical protein ISF26_20755 [Gloeobacter morelensis MG652769]
MSDPILPPNGRDCCFGADPDLLEAVRNLQTLGDIQPLPVFDALERAGLTALQQKSQAATEAPVRQGEAHG